MADMEFKAAGRHFKIRSDGDIMVKSFGWVSDSWEYVGYCRCNTYYDKSGKEVGTSRDDVEKILKALLWVPVKKTRRFTAAGFPFLKTVGSSGFRRNLSPPVRPSDAAASKALSAGISATKTVAASGFFKIPAGTEIVTTESGTVRFFESSALVAARWASFRFPRTVRLRVKSSRTSKLVLFMKMRAVDSVVRPPRYDADDFAADRLAGTAVQEASELRRVVVERFR